MTLVNATLALGSLAFVVPLAIHLFFRSRYRVVDWGAMHLLSDVIAVNRRRLRWLNWMLLLLRCLIPAVLAICLARPLVTGWVTPPGSTPRSIAIVIDDSLSMAALTDEGSRRRIDRAADWMAAALRDASRSDEVALIGTSGVASTSSAVDAIERIESIEPTGSPFDLIGSLDTANRWMTSAAHPQREIWVVSDFGSGMIEAETLAALRQDETVDPQPVMTWFDVGDRDGVPANVSIDDLAPIEPATIAGRPTTLRGMIRNAGDQAVTEVPIRWTLDGRELNRDTVTIPARSSVGVRQVVRPEEAGSHAVELSVGIADALTQDNRRAIAIDAMGEVRVGIVEPADVRRGTLSAPGGYLRIALSPFALAGEGTTDAIQTRSILPAELPEQLRVGEPNIDVLVLAELPSPDSSLRSAVADYVIAGGRLIVAGDRTLDPDLYNQEWRGRDGRFRLPATLGSLVEVATQSDQTDAPDQTDPPEGRLPSRSIIRSTYPPWRWLSESDGGAAEIRLNRFRVLENVDPNAIVPLRVDQRRPIVVIANHGKGKVVQFAIGLSPDSSTFPIRRLFLPMMQQLVLDLAGSSRGLNLRVGERIRIESSTRDIVVTDPSGEVNRIARTDPDGEQSDASEPLIATRPGIYRIRSERIDAPQYRVATIAPSESNLKSEPPSRVESAAEMAGAAVHQGVETFLSADSVRRYGREIWRPLLAVLLMAMVGEVVLARHVSGRAPAAVPS